MAAVWLGLMALPMALHAQISQLGGETAVNSTTASHQQHVAAAMDSSQRYVLAWESMGQDGDGYGIYAQLHEADGSVLQAEWLVPDSIAGDQQMPAVAMAPGGRFVVVWQSLYTDGDGWGLFAQLYDAAGNEVNDQLQLNTNADTVGQQRLPAVAIDSSGAYVVAFENEGDIFYQKVSAAGALSGSPVQVNTHTSSMQSYPSIAMALDGRFVVVWQSLGQDGDGQGIYGQRFGADGSASGSEFKVNTTTTGNQQEPTVAGDYEGNFVVAWASRDQDGDHYGIYGQRYAADGSPQGTEFLVNTSTAEEQNHPQATMGYGGFFAIAWAGKGSDDADKYGAFLQTYGADGSPYHGDTLLNTSTTGFQTLPALAFFGSGGQLVAAWQDGDYTNPSGSADGDGFGVFAQRWQTPDSTPPLVLGQDLAVYLASDGTVTADAQAVDAGSYDASGIAGFALSASSFTCGELGDTTVTFTVTDNAGLKDSTTVTLTVTDTISPTASARDITVYLDGDGNATLSADTVDDGSTDLCGIASRTLDVSSFTCDDLGTNTVTLTVTDASGNAATETATITVVDTIAPAIATRNNFIRVDADGNATLNTSDIDNGSTDNCGIASMSLDVSNFTCDDLGGHTVTLTVTDASGNSSSATAALNVLDTSVPKIFTQDVTVSLDASGNATLSGSDIDNGSTDNCSIASRTLDLSSFSCDDLGDNTVTLTVTDGSGNSNSGTATVTVQDNTQPTVLTQNITISLDASGAASITTADVDNGSSDNCGINSRLLDISSFSCDDLGTNTVTLTVTDPSGNSNSNTATVTVQDNTQPTVSTQDITISLDASGNATLSTGDIDNGSTDNCSIASLGLDVSSFNCTHLGDNTVTLTVTDGAGNSNSGTATVTVQDNTQPTVSTQDITISLDASGNATLSTGDIDNGSTDNCSIASLGLDVSSFNCTHLGDNTVTLTVTDGAGNSNSGTATVTVQDNTLPTVSTQDITISLDASGNASLSASDINNGSTDNCSIASMGLDVSSFNCTNLGDNTVTLTVTDGAGNSNSSTATVTVQDNTLPTVATQNISIDLDASGNATLSASDIDNGSSDNCSITSRVLDVSSFSCANLGDNTVTLTVTDGAGNSNSSTATVTVQDVALPAVLTKDVALNLDASGNATLSTSDIDDGSSDNCGIAGMSLDMTSFSCADLGPNTVTLTVTDGAGNSNASTAMVTVQDNIPPIEVTQDVTVSLDASGNASILASDLDNGSTDNCGIASRSLDVSSFTCANLGPNTVNLTVTDGSGNSSMGSATVIVQDIMTPTVFTQDVTLTLDSDGNATLSTSDIDNGSTDNCSIASMSLDVSSFNCSNLGPNTVTLTVTDGSGNSNTSNATVTVEDNMVPTVATQDITVNLDASGTATLSASDIDNGSSDNCGIASRVLDVSSFTCSNAGANTVTLTVTDAAGNSSSGTATVLVLENTAPTVITQDLTLNLDASGTATLSASDVDNGSSDNCGITSRVLDVSSFNCANLGSNTVTLTVTDGSGNSSSATATVTVQDITAPTAATQDLTLSLGTDGTATLSASAIDNGSSDNCSIASRVLDITSFTCANLGSNTVTLTVTDVAGNSSSSTANVTVQDITAPTVATQDLTVSLGADGTVSISPSDVDNGSSDNCSIASRVLDVSSFTCSNVGANTVTLTVTDAASNSSNSTATVTVQDIEAPVVATQDITVSLDASGAATLSASDIDNGSSDNCSIASRVLDVSSFNCTNLGTNTVTLTITDGFGNSSSGTATVMVQDITAPTVATQDLTLSLGTEGTATLSASAIDNGSSDNCSIASRVLDVTSFTCANLGSNLVTLTVTDDSGNSSSGTATVTVQDITAPTVATQDLTVSLGADGTVSISPSDVDNGSSDNCSIASRVLDVSSFTCSNVGANTVTLTVTDAAGNSSNSTATVTVQDIEAPVVATQDITVSLDASGAATLSASDIDNGSSDNCSIASRVLDVSNFNCTNLGNNTVTLTVTDGAGNSSSNTATVTVQDITAPTVATQDLTVSLGTDGTATLSASAIDNGSTDNCSIASRVLDVTSFTCANLGSNLVTLTVTDGAGNSSSGTATVTVQDAIAPTVITQDITVTLDASGTATLSASDVDNGSTDNCSIASRVLDVSSFTCSNIGTNTVTLTVTDGAGNSSTATATVTVQDITAPTVVTQDITLSLDGSGMATLSASDIDNGSTDNCSIASRVLDVSSFSCANLGANTVTLTVTDGAGNSNSSTAIVTVEDNTTPAAVTQNITVSLDASGMASITPGQINGGSLDNCSLASLSLDMSSFTCAHLGNNTVTLTVTDAAGNSSSATATVMVQDILVPTVQAQDITVSLGGDGTASISASDINNGSTDNCSIATLSLDVSTFTCANLGANTVTLTVTDNSGNSNTGTSTVTVQDLLAPTVLTQDITVDLGADGTVAISPSDLNNGSADNCSIASLSLDNSTFTCNNLGANTVTLTVTDQAGNSNTGTATVTVRDPEAPTVLTQDITLSLDASGNATLSPSDLDNGSTDNCGIASRALDVSSFSCANLGPNTVTLTITDGSGNSNSATATVTVQDNIAPTVVTQSITVTLDASGNATLSPSDLDNGSSDNCGIASRVLDVSSFTCSNLGTNTVNLTLTDNSGNSNTSPVTVLVQDLTAPTVSTKGHTLYLDATGNASISPSDIDDNSTDNCGIANFGLNASSFNCSHVGAAQTVTLTATDGSGNSASGTATVTVLDTVPPTMQGQEITVSLDESGTITITPNDVDAGSFDACGLNLSLDQNTFTCSNLGPTTVTLTGTDPSGNRSSTTVTVNVVAERGGIEVATKPSTTLYLDAAGQATLDVAVLDNGSQGACGSSITLSASQTLFNCAHLGTNTITFTVEDAFGNVAQAITPVTVLDTLAPTALARADTLTVYLDSMGVGRLGADSLDAGSTDNCGLSFSLSRRTFSCNQLDVVTTVDFFATDGAGNAASQPVRVIVRDTLAPKLVLQDVVAPVGPSGFAVVRASDIDGGTTDNCSFTMIMSTVLFDCNLVETQTIAVAAIDQSGNLSRGTVLVTVVDTTAPTVITQDLTMGLNGSNSLLITESAINNGTYDNCTLESITLSKYSFTIDDLGVNEVVLTATDAEGNVSRDTALVTILEEINRPPSVSNQAMVVAEFSPIGTVVDTIAANDLDGDPLTFALVEGNLLGTFNLDPASGAITVANDILLDRAVTQRFILQITVTDGTSTVNASIVITIVDPNTVVGLPPALEQGLALYPNPTRGWLMLEGEGADWAQAQVSLYNLWGAHLPLPTPVPEGNRLHIDAATLPSGHYMLQVQHQGSVYRLRFVKE